MFYGHEKLKGLVQQEGSITPATLCTLHEFAGVTITVKYYGHYTHTHVHKNITTKYAIGVSTMTGIEIAYFEYNFNICHIVYIIILYCKLFLLDYISDLSAC